MSDGGSSGNLQEDYVVTDKGDVVSSSGNTIGVDNPFPTSSSTGGGFNIGNFDFGRAANAILGGSGGGMGAGMALGLGALASALSRQQAPEIKQPEYKAAPVYNRALTAPLMPPQPPPQKSASGQNIYTPMRGMPLFFNPNPFQFDPTEAAKRYGPTPEQIAQGQAGYEKGLASLYKPMNVAPITYPGTSTVTGATGNDTVSGGGAAAPKTLPSDPIQAFRSSSEYQDFLKANEGGIGTMDMYDSPYFGPVSSGSYGGAQDKAYKDWYQKTYNTEAPIVYKTQSNQASDMAGLLNTIYGQNASAPVQGGATGGAVSELFVGYDDVPAGYNDGGDVYMAAGRYLNGDGDGMSDSIPATINNKQPARLADGEFVVPADVVSDLGNGSSNAGAQRLHKMMRDIRMARHKTTKQPPEVNVKKAMPA